VVVFWVGGTGTRIAGIPNRYDHRSMASYSLLNTFSGFRFDMGRGMVGFDPIQPDEGSFRCFWSLAPAWGEFEMVPGRVTVRVLYGELPLQELQLPFAESAEIASVMLDGIPASFTAADGGIQFESAVEVGEGMSLAVVFEPGLVSTG